jgi:hypothetical protein
MKKIFILFITGSLLTSCANVPNLAKNVVNITGESLLDSAIVEKNKKNKKKEKKEKKEKGKKTNQVFKLEEIVQINTKRKNNPSKKMTKAIIVGLGTATVATMKIIGGKLAEYFTEQDKHNAVQVLEKTDNAKSVAWCSNSKDVSENVEDVKCTKTNKIIQTPSPVTQKESKTCRILKTEVVTVGGEIQTETQNLCKNEQGEWYDENTQ